MTQSDLQSLAASNPALYEASLQSVTLTAGSSSEASGFLINPWLGLIGLAVLVISGAVAVIREIQIEEEDTHQN